RRAPGPRGQLYDPSTLASGRPQPHGGLVVVPGRALSPRLVPAGSVRDLRHQDRGRRHLRAGRHGDLDPHHAGARGRPWSRLGAQLPDGNRCGSALRLPRARAGLLPELQRSEPARLPGPMACAAGGRSVTTLAISDPAYARVAAFLYREAELLDHGRFEEWLELLAAELQYRAPVPTTDGG